MCCCSHVWYFFISVLALLESFLGTTAELFLLQEEILTFAAMFTESFLSMKALPKENSNRRRLLVINLRRCLLHPPTAAAGPRSSSSSSQLLLLIPRSLLLPMRRFQQIQNARLALACIPRFCELHRSSLTMLPQWLKSSTKLLCSR